MVDYNVHYNIAALFLVSIVVIVFSARKKSPFLYNRFFLYLCLAVMASTLFDVLGTSTIMDPFGYPKWYLYFSNYLYLIFHNVVAFVYIMYILNSTCIFY